MARRDSDAHGVFEQARNHQTPERLPIDYVASRGVDQRLRRRLGVTTERDLLSALGCDFYYLSVRDISQNETAAKIYRGPALWSDERYRVCPLGIRYQRAQYDWKFGADECIGGALDKAETTAEILRHEWPRAEWFDVESLGEECEAFGDRVIIGGMWTAIFGNAYRLYGFERFLMDMALRPEVIKTLVRRLTDFYLELDERYLRALQGKVDIFFFGNDFGSQQGLLFSEPMWAEFFEESYRRIIELIHRYGMTVMVHSCGSIAGILPHLVELGVEIIDPVQTTAAGMAPERLKREFGGEIVFHGAIDTQEVLPYATPEQVQEHVHRTAETLARDGGYIFAPCNNIQDDTPVENVMAAYEAARRWRPRA